MFERFTSSYFLGRLYVEPSDRPRAAIHEADHRRANEHLYATGEGLERLDHPLVMKFDDHGPHFPVVGDDSVPTGTLVVPRELADGRRAGHQELLLAAADRAEELLRYSGYTVDPRGDGGGPAADGSAVGPGR
jgi:hypothetical protein